jgi:hypothetical protein
MYSRCTDIGPVYVHDDYLCYGYAREEHCSSFWRRTYNDRWAEVSLDLAMDAAFPWHGQSPPSRYAPASQSHQGHLPELIVRDGHPVEKSETYRYGSYESYMASTNKPDFVIFPPSYLVFADEYGQPMIVAIPGPEPESHTPFWAYFYRVVAYPFAAAWDILTFPVQIGDELRHMPPMGF